MKYLLNSNKGITSLALILVSASSSVLIAGYSYILNKEQNFTPKEITNYEECTKAGYPILETYPEQCITPNGKSFIRELKEEEKIRDSKVDNINSFEECIEFGYPKIHSDPAICKTPNGKAFVEKDNSVKKNDRTN